MINITHIAVAFFAFAGVATVAWLSYRFQLAKLSAPQPRSRYDFEGAVTQLQDSMDAGGRAHVKRCDELDDELQVIRRANDKRFYEIEQQVMRLTTERESDRTRFDSTLAEAASERNKLAQMLSTRVPHGRIG